MPYSMSDLYANTRTHVRKFYMSYLIFVLYSFYTGAVIFLIYYMGIKEDSILLDNGWTQDLFSFGVFTVMTFVLQHHIHVSFMVRNWSFIFVCLMLASMI